MLPNHSWFLCCWAVLVGPGSEAPEAKEGASQLRVQARNTVSKRYSCRGERGSFGTTGSEEVTVSSFLLCLERRVGSKVSGW